MPQDVPFTVSLPPPATNALGRDHTQLDAREARLATASPSTWMSRSATDPVAGPNVLGRPSVLLLTQGNASDVRKAPEVAGRNARHHSPPERRQRLRRRRAARRPAGEGHYTHHPRQTQPQSEDPPRQTPIPRTLARRGHLLPSKGLPPRRNPLRQTRSQLRLGRRTRRGRRLLVLIESDPSTARSYRPHQYRESILFI